MVCKPTIHCSLASGTLIIKKRGLLSSLPGIYVAQFNTLIFILIEIHGSKVFFLFMLLDNYLNR